MVVKVLSESQDLSNEIPLVSILMTVFNGDEFLIEALESLQAQTFQNWEVVVFEHGSTDSSLDLLRSWPDKRLILSTSDTNIGRTNALNTCLKMSRGQLIAVLDADDLSDSERIRKQVEFLIDNPKVGLVGSWSMVIDEKGELIMNVQPPPTHAELVRAIAVNDPIIHSSMMFRRSLAEAVGGYNQDLKYGQDFGLLIEIAGISKIAVIEEPLCFWRVRSSSLTQDSSQAIQRAIDEVYLFSRSAKLLPFAPSVRLKNYGKQFLVRSILIYRLLRERHYRLSLIAALSPSSIFTDQEGRVLSN